MVDTNEKLSWIQFESCNSETTLSFEKMCRLLFNYNFFDGKEIFHSNPNNPGIEVLPVYHIKSKKRISFQAKYFSNIDYRQIEKSATNTVNHYAGKIDRLYLYCNKDLTTTAESYKKIADMLDKNGIELVLICNQTILEQVLHNTTIQSYYFNKHFIDKQWFEHNLNLSIESLGMRYNKRFNVQTNTEEKIHLFTMNDDGVFYLNAKKTDAISKIRSIQRYSRKNSDYLLGAIKYLEKLDSITINNVKECLDWEENFKKFFSSEIFELDQKYKLNQKEVDSLFKPEDRNKKRELVNENVELLELIKIPKLLNFQQSEKNLILNKVLIIRGEAGVGKSHLFANAAKEIVNSGGFSILMLGQNFINSNTILEQISCQFEFMYNIDVFFDVLEGLGRENNQCIVLFFDAINESENRRIWKTGINQLISKLSKYDFIRIAFSLRLGYENSLLDDSISSKMKRKEITVLNHEGFREESIEASKEFLNGYNIPFSPASFLQYQITNPLFLTLLCRTYSGEELDFTELFNNLIVNADDEIQKALGYDIPTRLLPYLINDIIEYIWARKSNKISKTDLLNLDFWIIHGLTSKKIPFLSTLEKTDILYTFMSNDVEYYYFSYNLLQDFLTAKHIMNKYSTKTTLVNYIKKNLLQVDKYKLVNQKNTDIFIYICLLFAERYDEECIYLTDSLESSEKERIYSEFIKSFSIRKGTATSRTNFLKIIEKEKFSYSDLWCVLIENSTKTNHPLNSDFLHEILNQYTLSQRDAYWTTYINDLSSEEERLYQLIELFHSGNSLNGLSENNIKLLLTLFGWLLSSSNRKLRDKTSKAMIEILSDNFELCIYLLEKFETVDDPYIIQRLYGVVFGACTRRTFDFEENFKELSTYIYVTIFNKEFIYPDILLRDYARLIIERYFYEFGPDDIDFDFSKVMPPYRSKSIPHVKKECFNLDYMSGFSRIASSMQPDITSGPGIYGDFGRYVFEVALNDFSNIDLENLYYYALKFIKEELKYTEEYFGEYDTHLHHPMTRGDTDRYERIGKKYQWIAMYNILSRISDTHKLTLDMDRMESNYKGAYNPYVRDFDPTLNDNFSIMNDLPIFNLKEQHEFTFENVSLENKKLVKKWADSDTSYFSSHADKFTYTDSDGEEWILLSQYEEIKNGNRRSIDSSSDEQRVWTMSNSYLVSQGEFEAFKKELQHRNFNGRAFPESHSTYSLYNREYPWSYSCEDIYMFDWHPYQVKTGESVLVERKEKYPVFIDDLKGEISTDRLTFTIKENTSINKEYIYKTIGAIMPSCFEITWEEANDYSKKETFLKFLFPNKLIYEDLNLRQRKNDGYYYDSSNALVAFDGRLREVSSGLLIKKENLVRFLDKNNLKLFWTCLGEKQHFSGFNDQIWSTWSGFLYLDGINILGNMKRFKSAEGSKK